MTSREFANEAGIPPGQVVRSSPMPAWAQVVQHFKRAIDEGTIVGEQRLPSETDLAVEFGVSRITMRRALGHLSAEGYVDRRQGIGTFVSPRRLPIQHDLSLDSPWRDRLRLQGHRPLSRVVETGLHDALPVDVVGRVQNVDSSPTFAYFKRLQCVDGEPIGLTESWVPVSIAPGIDEKPLIEGSLSETLKQRYGLETAQVDNVVEAVLATASDAQLLETFVDVPLFVVTAVGRRKDGAVMHVSRTSWVAGRVRFQYLHKSTGQARKR